MTAAARYVNPRTGAEWPADRPLWRAPDDGGHVDLTPGAGLTAADIEAGERSLWRYAAAIRLPRREVTLGEGWTPLLEASWQGAPVLLKCDQLMPTGSFKDRGTAVMLSYLRQAGVEAILEDSSGNAGASIATYAAAAGLACTIMVPAAAPAAKRIQMAAMGADVVAIAGTRQDVAEAALKAADGTFYASHNYQPYFLEGTKTLAFELWEQLGFRAPDHVVVPLGYGSNVLGLHLGFEELIAAGQVASCPRIHAVQAANCAPFLATWQSGGDAYVPIEPKPTLADGIASSKPVRIAGVIRAVRSTGGSVVAVSEDEIVTAFKDLAAIGQFVEPTCAAGAAALTRLVRNGTIAPGDTTVLVLTGSGLKAVSVIGEVLGIS